MSSNMDGKIEPFNCSHLSLYSIVLHPYSFFAANMSLLILKIVLVSIPFLLSLLFFLHHQNKSKSKSKSNIPPGPPSLPIIGNLHQLDPLAHHSLYNISKLHGPIFQLNLGRIPTVIISSPSLAEQVLKTHDLATCSRPRIVSFQEYSYNGCDVAAAAYGDHWRNLRKVFVLELLSLKKLSSFRSIQEEETERMISSIKTQLNSYSTVNITELMVHWANNIIFRVAFGFRSEGEYGEKSRFQKILEEANATVVSFYVADYFPGFGWVDKMTGRMRKLKRIAREIDESYQEVIDGHLKDEKKPDSQEDIVDVLLRLWKEGELTMDHIKGAIMHVFVGGTDTSSATITWAMAELARNPEMMRKAQDEVRKVVGKKGKVEESDILQLQNIKLVVKETLRLHPPLPLLVPRETMQHCKINGYNISPKTRVIVNAWAIGRDENTWENSEEFKPERFIGSSVDYRGQDFQLIPFGAGRRICPGIQLGITNVELPLANLLYNFNWELPPGMKNEDIDMHEAPGLITHKKNDLCLVSRNYKTGN